MHTVVQPSAAPPADSAPVARVAVAGAPGLPRQELLRLAARPPAVALPAAMSSGQASGAARRLPALAHLWSGEIVPLSVETLTSEADLVFLALPDSAAAGLAPAPARARG